MAAVVAELGFLASTRGPSDYILFPIPLPLRLPSIFNLTISQAHFQIPISLSFLSISSQFCLTLSSIPVSFSKGSLLGVGGSHRLDTQFGFLLLVHRMGLFFVVLFD